MIYADCKHYVGNGREHFKLQLVRHSNKKTKLKLDFEKVQKTVGEQEVIWVLMIEHCKRMVSQRK